MQCKHCKSKYFTWKCKGPHHGLWCYKCGKFHKWVNDEDLHEVMRGGYIKRPKKEYTRPG